MAELQCMHFSTCLIGLLVSTFLSFPLFLFFGLMTNGYIQSIKHYTLPAVVMCVYLFVFIFLLSTLSFFLPSFCFWRAFKHLLTIASSSPLIYLFFGFPRCMSACLILITPQALVRSKAKCSNIFFQMLLTLLVCHLHDVLLPSISSYLCHLPTLFVFLLTFLVHANFYKLPWWLKTCGVFYYSM